MQSRLESKTEDALSMWKEDDPYRDGDREDLEVVLEVEGIPSRPLLSRHMVLDQVVTVVALEVDFKVGEVVGSEADSEVTEVVMEVGIEEEEVSAIRIEVVVEGSAVARLLMLLVVREEGVDLEGTKTDEMDTEVEVVGMAVVEIEEQLAATEIPLVAAEIDTTTETETEIEIGMVVVADETTITVRERDNTTVINTTIGRSADISRQTGSLQIDPSPAHTLREIVLLSAIIYGMLVGTIPLCMLHSFKFPTKVKGPWLR